MISDEVISLSATLVLVKYFSTIISLIFIMLYTTAVVTSFSR